MGRIERDVTAPPACGHHRLSLLRDLYPEVDLSDPSLGAPGETLGARPVRAARILAGSSPARRRAAHGISVHTWVTVWVCVVPGRTAC